MRIQLLTGSAVLLFGMLGANASFAQAQNSMEISGSLGAMTCADFTKLGPTAQADAVSQLSSGSLTSNSGASAKTSTPSASTVSGTPLEAGQLVAACQGASGTSTVQDAFSNFNSGTKPAK